MNPPEAAPEIYRYVYIVPDNEVYGANMGPTWGRQDPGGSHVGPLNLLSGVYSIDLFY